MVEQMVHLNTFRSLGHLTSDEQVMQLPVAKSLLLAAEAPGLGCFPVLAPAMTPASSPSTLRSGAGRLVESCLLFLVLKSEGKGLLIERACWGREVRGRDV